MGLFKKKTEISKKYDLLEDLGSGNFAVVKRAKCKKAGEKTDEGVPIPAECAIKVIDKAKVEDMGDIQREIEIMAQVSHPNIIRLYEIHDEPKFMHLVMELVTGGELFDRIVSRGTYTEKDAAGTMSTLCDALNYLHERKIVHRDLKPENILYASPADDAPIKIADFGLARTVDGKGELMKTACGTPGYVAPEILSNKGYDSCAVDLWSSGVILYILLCGFPPFYEEELPALFDSILHARYDFPSPWWDHISKDAKSLVIRLLEKDPIKRLTAAQVLTDKWVTTASDNDLSDTQKALKKYNATRKLRKVAMGIIAKNRIQKAFGDFRQQQSEKAAGS